MSDTATANPSTIQSVEFSVNLLSALLWQYSEAPNLTALLQAKQAWYQTNHVEFWEDWITDVFDLRTCNDFGLAVWAIILGIPLTYIVGGSVENTMPFGFGPDEIGSAANGNQNFFNSTFSDSNTTQISLTTDQKRIILQLRYRQLIARGTVPEVNKILADLLVPDYGPMWMIDGLNMTQSIVCLRGVPAFLAFLFTEFDIIPRPAGVDLFVIDASYPCFGFGPDEIGGTPNGNQNFYYSTFTPNTSL
jgi:hypothetical protein